MNDSIAVLVSGTLRSYESALAPFLHALPDHFHIFISCPEEHEDQYLNKITVPTVSENSSRIKYIQVLKEPESLLLKDLSHREKNTYLQWYRIQQIFKVVDPHKYKTIIRARPDILFSSDVDTFMAYFCEPLKENTVYIPVGFDIFHSQFQKNQSVNDQFAFGMYDSMSKYCNLFSHLCELESVNKPFISEEILFTYLTKSNIHIQRIDLQYTLLLSQCFTISICGDSASGKSSLAKLIQETLHFDKALLFETDRYHKWERGAKEYQHFTHLHPEANHLEKLSTDAYKLRLGQDVFLVDYDHSTGKFTEPQCVQPKHFTIFCGLHTLYLDSLRDIMDLKIYMDTDANLKEFWKIRRDTVHRGASPEHVRKTIAARIPDFQEFIEPQKYNANVWIRFFSSEPENPSELKLQIRIQEYLVSSHFLKKMQPFCYDITNNPELKIVSFQCNPIITAGELTAAAQSEGYMLTHLKDSYQGIFQYFLILLTWKQSSKNM